MEANQIKAVSFPEAHQIKAISLPEPIVRVAPIPIPVPIPTSAPSFPVLPTQKLFYKAKYLGIPLCEYIIQNKGKIILNGREVYSLEIAVITNPVLEKLFKSKDRYVSYMDAASFVVLRHEEYVQQGTVLESAVDFDYTHHVANYKNFIDHTEKVTPIPDKVFDVISGGFYLKMVPWELGDTVEINIYADEKVYNFIGLVHSTTTLNLPPQGKQEAYFLKPYLFYNGVYMKNLSAETFFSTAVPRIPLRAVLNTFLGSVSVVLVEK